MPFKSWFWAQVTLPVLLSLSLSLSHTHTHTHSLSLLCRTNFPHWAEKIAVSQAPHPSCSTLRIIKKRGCAGLQIHWLKQGLTTLGESDFRTTCGVSQWPRVFHRASDCPLQPYRHQEAVMTRSCEYLFMVSPCSLCLCGLSLSPVSNSITWFFHYHHLSIRKVRHRQFK